MSIMKSYLIAVQIISEVTVKTVFSQRVIDIWNSLSEFIVSAPSTNTFKKRIDNNWKKIWGNL